MSNENGSTRLERIEKALDLLTADHVQFREEHKQLLTAQVLLAGAQQKTEKNLAALVQRVEELAGAQRVTELRVTELAETFRSFLDFMRKQ